MDRFVGQWPNDVTSAVWSTFPRIDDLPRHSPCADPNSLTGILHARITNATIHEEVDAIKQAVNARKRDSRLGIAWAGVTPCCTEVVVRGSSIRVVPHRLRTKTMSAIRLDDNLLEQRISEMQIQVRSLQEDAAILCEEVGEAARELGRSGTPVNNLVMLKLREYGNKFNFLCIALEQTASQFDLPADPSNGETSVPALIRLGEVLLGHLKEAQARTGSTRAGNRDTQSAHEAHTERRCASGCSGKAQESS